MNATTLFGPTGNITCAQECARAAVIFFYGLVVVRVAGRRVFAQWSPVDIIVAIVTGSTLSRALTGNADLLGTLAATTLLMALHWAFTQLAARWPAVSRLVEGKPVQLAADGELIRGALHRHAISASALEQAIRTAGLEAIGDARAVVLEPSGKISVVKR